MWKIGWGRVVANISTFTSKEKDHSETMTTNNRKLWFNLQNLKAQSL